MAPPIHQGGGTKEQGVKEKDPSSGLQGVGTMACKELVQEGIVQRPHERAGNNDANVQSVDLETEGREESYGSWMLVKRGRKKKGVPPNAPKVRIEGARRSSEQGHTSSAAKVVGSRPRSGEPNKDVIVGSVVTVAPQNKVFSPL